MAHPPSKAAGLNYIDVYHRTGYYSQPLPFIPGLEGAGTVEPIGQDVSGLKVGDRVAYAGPAGGYSEVRLIEDDRLVRLPNAISEVEAAGFKFDSESSILANPANSRTAKVFDQTIRRHTDQFISKFPDPK